MDDLYQHKNLIVSEVEGGLAGLRAKIEEVQPTIVIHDYMKGVAEDEMGDKMNVKEQQYVARVADKFKSMARHFKIPIIACGHANREGDKSRGKSSVEIAHADHIARRADLVLRVIVDESRDMMALITVAGRNVQKFLSWTIDASMSGTFGNFVSENASWVDDVEDANKSEAKAKENPEVEATLEKVTSGLRNFKPRRK
jgi:hypothetical protein